MSSDPGYPPSPLDPLPYQSPARQLRPGLMTAMAIVSIVIACFSALANLGSIASGFIFMAMSRMTVPIPVAGPGPTSAAAAVPTTGPTTFPTTSFSPFQMTPTILILTALGGILGLLAAGVLIAAGIQVLRNRRSGRTLHWIFVAIKVPITLFVAVGTYMMSAAMMRNVSTVVPTGAGAMPFTGWLVLVQTVFYAIISLAYPLTLAFLLRSRNARDYFASLTT